MNRVFYTGSMGESGVARSDTRHAGRRGQGMGTLDLFAIASGP